MRAPTRKTKLKRDTRYMNHDHHRWPTLSADNDDDRANITKDEEQQCQCWVVGWWWFFFFFFLRWFFQCRRWGGHHDHHRRDHPSTGKTGRKTAVSSGEGIRYREARSCMHANGDNCGRDCYCINSHVCGGHDCGPIQHYGVCGRCIVMVRKGYYLLLSTRLPTIIYSPWMFFALLKIVTLCLLIRDGV